MSRQSRAAAASALRSSAELFGLSGPCEPGLAPDPNAPAQGMSEPERPSWRLPASLDELYRRHGVWLRDLLRRRFGADQAEDLAQEAYTRAAAFRGEVRNPQGFLVCVAVNAARDLARRRAVRPATVELWDREPGVAAPASQDTAVQLKQVILALPPKLREVFLLSRFGGLTYPEIAQRCGISIKTVEARMSKALAMCAALME